MFRFVENLEIIAAIYAIPAHPSIALIETENIVIDAVEVNDSTFDGFIRKYKSEEIALPSALLAIGKHDMSEVRRIQVIFYNSSVFFRDETLENKTGSLPANSVIAASVSHLRIRHLPNPVILRFRRFNTPVSRCDVDLVVYS